MVTMDQEFLALPLEQLADAALSKAKDLGATHCDVRIGKIRTYDRHFRDCALQASTDVINLGVGVRVIYQGSWGFAAGTALTSEAMARLAEQAILLAKVSQPLLSRPVELAPEPVHANKTWIGQVEINPFEVSEQTRIGRMVELCEKLSQGNGVSHTSASLHFEQENKFYADLAGSSTFQQRIRMLPEFQATCVTDDFHSMRSVCPPVGRGWEFLGNNIGFDFDAEIHRMPDYLAEKVKAPQMQAGRFDIVVDSSNLWLTIHESIAHGTELDRALGYEAAYAGSSFATFDQLETLKYGSALLNVTGDRVTEHGLATVGYDDEGVAAQNFTIIKDGILVGYQLNRQMAQEMGLGRSNGCAYAENAGYIQMQRMPNVSMQADPSGPDLDGLLAGVDDGLYIVGDNSWSIDMQRYNFQFTGQRFYRIKNGKLTHQVKDCAYQATTTDFWGSLQAVGGPQTWKLQGALNCGKAQPGQVAPVSHGCPAAMFSDINIISTAKDN